MGLLMLFCFSCKRTAYDFSRMNGIDAEGSWGIPLVNADLSIGDILSLADNPSFIQTGNDGTLEITYQLEKDSLISSEQLLGIMKDKVISASKTLTVSGSHFPHLPQISFTLYNDTTTLEFPADEAVLDYARIKSGLLTLHLAHDIPINFTVEVSSPQIKDAANHDFHVTYNINAYEDNQIDLDLSGYTLVPNAVNKADIYLHLTAVSSGAEVPNNPVIQYSVLARKLVLEELRGRIKAFDMDLDESLDFDLSFLSSQLGGSITLYNPQVECLVQNTFPIGADLTVRDASFSGTGVPTTSLLSSSPVTIHMPANTQSFESVPLPLTSSLFLNTNMSSLHFAGTAVLNPNGMNTPVLTVTEHQTINLKIAITLPLKVKLDRITFHDTLDFGGADIPDINGISNIVFRFRIENQLPLGFDMQAYFYDSQAHRVRDSLFTTPMAIPGYYGGMSVPCEAYIAKEDVAQIQRMLSCDKIILKAGVNTDDHQVAIRSDQTLKVRLSAKFDVDLGTLANQYLQP